MAKTKLVLRTLSGHILNIRKPDPDCITLNDIAIKPTVGDNFRRMVSAGYKDYTTEAIVCDYPQVFSKDAVDASTLKLKKFK